MTDRIGFIVLARRPNPYREHPWDYEAISKVYDTADEADHALDWVPRQYEVLHPPNPKAVVEYVVGEVSAVSMEKPPWPKLT